MKRRFALLLIPLLLAAGCATTPDPSTAIPDLTGIWQSFDKGGVQGLGSIVRGTFGNDG